MEIIDFRCLLIGTNQNGKTEMLAQTTRSIPGSLLQGKGNDGVVPYEFNEYFLINTMVYQELEIKDSLYNLIVSGAGARWSNIKIYWKVIYDEFEIKFE